ncbi:MAG: phospholipid carrier-dependent glycosyltransferase [Nitrososphaerota archaeon]|nr:phospholipid carrier-dependent glycosyltransferase [Nitrososphaerota archaeon]
MLRKLDSVLRSEMFRSLRFWLAVITLVIVVLKLLIIPYPWPELPPAACTNPPIDGGRCGFIFDEAHYIPAVRKMLRGEAANNEHPPLSKALMMLGVLIFGDNPHGWRTIITLSGAASVYLVGLIAYELTNSKKISIIASLLFGFDITSFNISSMAILDAPALMFSLLGALLLLRKKWILSGISLGLASLSKTSAPFVMAGLLLYTLFESLYDVEDLRLALKRWVRILELTGFVAVATMVAGLAVYDYGYGAFSTPFEHIDYILNYHSSLTFSSGDVVDMPLSWANPIIQFPRASYYVVGVTVDGKEYHPISYYGMQTPLWWMTWIVVAFYMYLAYMKLRNGEFPRMELFILSWFLMNYFIYFPLAYLFHRWVYSFYFYMTVPMVAVGLPRILIGDKTAEFILYGLTLAQIAWFFLYFPVKPMWFIDFLLAIGAPA